MNESSDKSIWRPPEGLVVVNRHESLRKFMLERGYIDAHDIMIPHAKRQDIEGRHVIGKLPYQLAQFALSITEIPLRLDESDRGRGEIPYERLRVVALTPETYEVHRIA